MIITYHHSSGVVRLLTEATKIQLVVSIGHNEAKSVNLAEVRTTVYYYLLDANEAEQN